MLLPLISQPHYKDRLFHDLSYIQPKSLRDEDPLVAFDNYEMAHTAGSRNHGASGM